ncbi:Pyruvate formate-lyase 1-activating enzyme [Gemmata obscuriglobus]|uniref:Radical SAM protein n=1 Tax=Gemmata obscuriglobus TaxID=114 RepID=A0A2Z3GUH6_9BACT|nr:4Fe-4S single cluster domain-containing protein [Gemmata obscuriglobus]AWM36928.1 radical SAM protein [Gemmata obscuriglobus]QEG30392.1 Pyruvate formate-lyase 1-activating enzyme [Gemmata obscuriglobus]VTS09716.1 radical sam protein : Anaerobic ribonucleoside-triphosphate reductase-activating protein OS=Isosphaera pallida (strain ATCC 43644 / DSM 9630 / IS1B) GN=Isop_1721 PE=3 SV=1: Fer4_12: Radical_SAM [Gemmata obscuriglobus UQM 2246]
MDAPTATELTMQIAQIVPSTEAEGPGKRFALWFQGCPLRCPGCCNPEYLPFKGGATRTFGEVVAELRRARDEEGVEGITLMGGEPTAHAPAAAALARAARDLGLTVMTFTGFTVEELRAKADPAVLELIALTDILVDGPYVREQPDTERRWIGSTNQRIHFLTARYSHDEQWRKRNTLEIRVVGREITVNGFPAANAVGLWKGWRRKKPLPVAQPETSANAQGTDTK